MVKKYCTIIFFLVNYTAFSQSNVTIFDIARSGTVSQAQVLLQKNPKIVNDINADGYSSLILACYRGNNDVAKFLIESGANIDYNNAMGNALMAAVVKNNVDIVHLLLAKNADVNQTDANGTTALIYAVQFKNVSLVKLLLANKADKTKIDNNGKTAFEYAVFSDNQEIINLLK